MFSSIWGVKPELNLPVGKKLLQGSIAGGNLKMCLSQADHVKVLEVSISIEILCMVSLTESTDIQVPHLHLSIVHIDLLAQVHPGGQGVDLEGLRESRSRPIGSQGVKGYADRVPGGQGVGLQGPRGSRGRLTGSQGVKE